MIGDIVTGIDFGIEAYYGALLLGGVGLAYTLLGGLMRSRTIMIKGSCEYEAARHR